MKLLYKGWNSSINNILNQQGERLIEVMHAIIQGLGVWEEPAGRRKEEPGAFRQRRSQPTSKVPKPFLIHFIDIYTNTCVYTPTIPAPGTLLGKLAN